MELDDKNLSEEVLEEVEQEVLSKAEEDGGFFKNTLKPVIKDLIFYAVLFAVCLYVIPNFVIERTLVDGSSMESTLLDGENVMVEKVSRYFKAVDRFDVIVFRPDGKNVDYIKRVIGLPGETVQIKGATIYIDGEPLTEFYGKDAISYPGRAFEAITLAENEYFVLGDNRRISEDSRYDIVGNVRLDQIVGKAFIRVSPISKFGDFDKIYK
ncbi:MAG: signal peptidase I [Lachnospiraceae bacterium]|nr:signal peptidase I [Lachnospiraceae bacterium]